MAAIVVISAAAQMVDSNELIRNLKNGKCLKGLSAKLD